MKGLNDSSATSKVEEESVRTEPLERVNSYVGTYMRVKEAKSYKSVPIVIITYCENLKRIVEVILITDLRPKRGLCQIYVSVSFL